MQKATHASPINTIDTSMQNVSFPFIYGMSPSRHIHHVLSILLNWLGQRRCGGLSLLSERRRCNFPLLSAIASSLDQFGALFH